MRLRDSRVTVVSPDRHPRKRAHRSAISNGRAPATDVRDIAGCVGPFFAVREERTTHLIVYGIPLRRADIYGEMLTVDRGHAEIWEALAALGIRSLAMQGLPRVLLISGYDDFPRGRIVYDPAAKKFTVWADPKLHRPDIVEALKSGFSIGEAAYRVECDDHYRTAGPFEAFSEIEVHQVESLLQEHPTTKDGG